jgi:hypothetical protein
MGYGGATQGLSAAVLGNQFASVHQDHAAPQDLHQDNNASTGALDTTLQTVVVVARELAAHVATLD